MLTVSTTRNMFSTITIVLSLILLVHGDTPANCTYDEIVGQWTFKLGTAGGDNTIDCSNPGKVEHTVNVKLLYPDVAVDLDYGGTGFWTLIYNQGFEVVLNNRKYFAFSLYSTKNNTVTSHCDQTFPGWSHNVMGSDWACYVAVKEKTITKPQKSLGRNPKPSQNNYFQTDYEFISKINKAQSSWIAREYKEYEAMTRRDLNQRAGTSTIRFPKPAQTSQYTRNIAASLPLEFDWRDVNNQNFVSPIRDQGSCGSCYAFASTAMHEARLRIVSNNTETAIVSPQEVVSCSNYSQGCEGGFPYLIAGKYAEDYGFVEESCYPYAGKDSSCKQNHCKRYYATGYSYIGGYYGACNEELMRIQLVKNGPIAVSFMVYSDFMHYSSGIYHHTGLERGGFNPFEITNHVVLVVGYGSDNGEKFWIVKNSWGTSWGENGFFRIKRGVDECSIESIAVESFPIFP